MPGVRLGKKIFCILVFLLNLLAKSKLVWYISGAILKRWSSPISRHHSKACSSFSKLSVVEFVYVYFAKKKNRKIMAHCLTKWQ